MDVAAILSTSETLGMVTEAFSVRESRSHSIVSVYAGSADRMAWETALDGVRGGASASLTPPRSRAGVEPAALPGDRPWIGTPGPFIGPQPAAGGRVPTETLAELRGTALLAQLALLPRPELAEFAATHADVLAEVAENPPLAHDTAAWWGGAPPDARDRLLDEVPTLVGNLGGVPFTVRDEANRGVLEETIARLEARLDGEAGEPVGRAEADAIVSRLHMLGEIVAALEPAAGSGLARTLISLDTTGGGQAAIAIGDIAAADYVTYVVPGMFFGVDAQLVAWTGMADALAVEQNAWLARTERVEASAAAADPPTAATVSWIGYQTPTLVNVASMELAREGRDSLTDSLQGLEAARDDDPFVSIFAHSYGSTAAMLAVEQNAVTVDALAILGSPGSPADTAAELNVTDDNVWVGVAWWDPIPTSGVFGSQPASKEYGARHFEVDEVSDPVTGASLTGAVSHNDYFTPGGTSFRNLALIGIDRNDLVLVDGEASSLARTSAR